MAAIITKLVKVTYTFKMVRMRKRSRRIVSMTATLTRKDLGKPKMKIQSQIPHQVQTQIMKTIRINNTKLILKKKTLAPLDV